MNDETAREKLARTLGEAWITSGPQAWEEQSEGRRAGARHLADALLPVVREIAAEELLGADLRRGPRWASCTCPDHMRDHR